MALAILELDGIEIRTTDPICVRTLWGLMRTAVTQKDAAVLAGADPRTRDPEARS